MTAACATHGPVPAGEIRHLDHNSPTGHERHECGSRDDDGRWFEIRDETHVFVKSDTCDSDGLWGYTSMRCSLAYRGCDDRACVCRCHDQARTVEGTTTSGE